MRKIQIGKTDLEVTPVVLGGNVFGWTASEKTSLDILDAYVGQGFNMIDTADMYPNWAPNSKGGDSEAIIGKWVKRSNQREKILIATKVGNTFSKTQFGLKKEYIIKQAEDSLKRLQTDYIDLYYTHKDDLNTPIEETLEAYNLLIKQGKVRYIGASNMSTKRLEQSLKISKENNLPSYICIQPQYNLYDRQEYETEYQAFLADNKIGAFTYYSLASGFLTGKYKKLIDISLVARNNALKGYMNERGQKILDALHKVAKHHVATPAQIALAWLIANPTVAAPIASVSRVEQLDILECVNLKLTPECLKLLDEASAY